MLNFTWRTSERLLEVTPKGTSSVELAVLSEKNVDSEHRGACVIALVEPRRFVHFSVRLGAVFHGYLE